MKSGDAFELKHEGETWRVLAMPGDGGPFIAEVTLAHGAGPPGHSHVEGEVLEVLEGALGVWLAGETRTLRAGERIAFSAGTPHRIYGLSSTPVKVRATYDGEAFAALVAELPPGDRAGMVRMARHLARTDFAGSRITSPWLRAALRLVAAIGGLFGVRARIEEVTQ